MTRSVSYTPGEWLAVVSSELWALIDMRVDDARVPALWEASVAGLDEMLDVLLRDGLRALPAFAIVARDGEDLRYAVRAPADLILDGIAIDMSEVDTWAGGRRQLWPGHVMLRAQSNEHALQLPTGAGVMSAESIEITFAADGREASPSSPERLTARPPAAHPPASATASVPAPAEADSAPAQADRSHGHSEVHAPDPPAESHASTYYQLLISSTTDRDELLTKLNEADAVVEPADIPSPASKPTSDATSVWSGDLETDEQPLSPARPAPAEASQGGVADSLIDGLPWANRSPSARSSPPSPPVNHQIPHFLEATQASAPESAPAPARSAADDVAPGEVDAASVTVNRATLVRLMEAERAKGPTLLALRCQMGHLSPTYVAHCRVCHGTLADQTPVEVTRPALGELRMSNGSSVTLDRGVVLGRAPSTDIEDPAHRPNLVRLIDSAEISRMHASVMLDGWQVLLRDLGSQNGTILTLPGREPEQIRPNEDYVLEPGSRVSFADIVSCTFEVTG